MVGGMARGFPKKQSAHRSPPEVWIKLPPIRGIRDDLAVTVSLELFDDLTRPEVCCGY